MLSLYARGYMTKHMTLLEQSPYIGIDTWYFKFLLERDPWFPTNFLSIIIGFMFFFLGYQNHWKKKGVTKFDLFFVWKKHEWSKLSLIFFFHSWTYLVIKKILFISLRACDLGCGRILENLNLMISHLTILNCFLFCYVCKYERYLGFFIHMYAQVHFQ